jgi:hypothetical protein
MGSYFCFRCRAIRFESGLRIPNGYRGSVDWFEHDANDGYIVGSHVSHTYGLEPRMYGRLFERLSVPMLYVPVS